jgi:hypothetical protein
MSSPEHPSTSGPTADSSAPHFGTDNSNAPGAPRPRGPSNSEKIRVSQTSSVDITSGPSGFQASRKLANPLSGFSDEDLVARAVALCERSGLSEEEDLRAFRLGALLAGRQADDSLVVVDGLTDEEKEFLLAEVEHKWRNPKMLYWVIASEHCPFIFY